MTPIRYRIARAIYWVFYQSYLWLGIPNLKQLYQIAERVVKWSEL